MSKYPTSVPLPEVGEHTGNIIIGNLALPVGVDLHDLSLNVRALERTRQIIHLGAVGIVGEAGETSRPDYVPGSSNSSGAATIGQALKRKRHALGNAELDFIEDMHIFGSPAVTIATNNAETTQRIIEAGNKYPKGQYDPVARAHFMNLAIKQGMLSASRQANVTPIKLAASTVFYQLGLGVNYILDSRGGHHPNAASVLLETIIEAPLTYEIVIAGLLLTSSFALRKELKSDDFFIQAEKVLRRSMVPISAVDRHAAAALYIKTHRFVDVVQK